MSFGVPTVGTALWVRYKDLECHWPCLFEEFNKKNEDEVKLGSFPLKTQEFDYKKVHVCKFSFLAHYEEFALAHPPTSSYKYGGKKYEDAVEEAVKFELVRLGIPEDGFRAIERKRSYKERVQGFVDLIKRIAPASELIKLKGKSAAMTSSSSPVPSKPAPSPPPSSPSSGGSIESSGEFPPPTKAFRPAEADYHTVAAAEQHQTPLGGRPVAQGKKVTGVQRLRPPAPASRPQEEVLVAKKRPASAQPSPPPASSNPNMSSTSRSPPLPSTKKRRVPAEEGQGKKKSVASVKGRQSPPLIAAAVAAETSAAVETALPAQMQLGVGAFVVTKGRRGENTLASVVRIDEDLSDDSDYDNSDDADHDGSEGSDGENKKSTMTSPPETVAKKAYTLRFENVSGVAFWPSARSEAGDVKKVWSEEELSAAAKAALRLRAQIFATFALQQLEQQPRTMLSAMHDRDAFEKRAKRLPGSSSLPATQNTTKVGIAKKTTTTTTATTAGAVSAVVAAAGGEGGAGTGSIAASVDIDDDDDDGEEELVPLQRNAPPVSENGESGGVGDGKKWRHEDSERQQKRSETLALLEQEKGVWECAKCGNKNFARRSVCFLHSCKEPRPQEKKARQEDKKGYLLARTAEAEGLVADGASAVNGGGSLFSGGGAEGRTGSSSSSSSSAVFGIPPPSVPPPWANGPTSTPCTALPPPTLRVPARTAAPAHPSAVAIAEDEVASSEPHVVSTGGAYGGGNDARSNSGSDASTHCSDRVGGSGSSGGVDGEKEGASGFQRSFLGRNQREGDQSSSERDRKRTGGDREERRSAAGRPSTYANRSAVAIPRGFKNHASCIPAQSQSGREGDRGGPGSSRDGGGEGERTTADSQRSGREGDRGRSESSRNEGRERERATSANARSPRGGRDGRDGDGGTSGSSRSGREGGVARGSGSDNRMPCKFWKSGNCKRGQDCYYSHAGFPTGADGADHRGPTKRGRF
mmetsp:Transcript_73565/g.143929  ORF Transcript_73565/g.143929 Transcript_73565/m.143929 type:complete len:980 (+) Transcript_73565:97-3036(+)